MTPTEYAANVMRRFGTLDPFKLARMECSKLPRIHGAQTAPAKAAQAQGYNEVLASDREARFAAIIDAIRQCEAKDGQWVTSSAVSAVLGLDRRRVVSPALLDMFKRDILTRRECQSASRRWYLYTVKS